MQIARPASGFKIVERHLATAAIAAAIPHCPWLNQTYSNVKERLRMAAHKVGFTIKGVPTNRVFIDADPATNANRLVVAYEVLGDGVTIYSVKVLLIP